MIRLPPALERRLAALFPSAKERDRFVAELVEQGLRDLLPAARAEEEAPGSLAVGGSLHLFTDGGSRGNPGQAAIGCILEDPSTGTVLKQHAERIGVETNNVAEYKALIAGMRLALPYHPNRLICHLDSELVVKQLNGEYAVKMQTLRPFVDEIRELSSEFADVVFVHIPRQDNHRADALVNRALDELSRSAPRPPLRPYAPPPPPPRLPFGPNRW